MAKGLKMDECGDSEELQALFDSMSNATERKPEPEPFKPADTSGDNDDLQALFDSVASEVMGQVAEEAAATEAPAAEEPSTVSLVAAEAVETHGDVESTVFKRVGTMMRQLHNTLSELGYDQQIKSTIDAIPDTKERLNYIATLTAQAAEKVLNATDVAQPYQDKIQSAADGLGARWDRMFANELSVDEFKALAGETREFLRETSADAGKTREQLTEIMMAQDFQDLTGQVIKKVMSLTQELENGLLQVLIEVTPSDKSEVVSGLLNGPVINSEGRSDVVVNQEQVDDLLDSLGF